MLSGLVARKEAGQEVLQYLWDSWFYILYELQLETSATAFHIGSSYLRQIFAVMPFLPALKKDSFASDCSSIQPVSSVYSARY